MSQDFIDAATQGDVVRVKDMLLADPSLARSKDQNGLSVILKATYYGKRDVVAALLASGVQLDIFEAAATGQTDRVKSVIKEDPSLVNTYSVDGFTPLGLAAFFGHPETVDALLAGGAQANIASRESMKLTPLASAVSAQQKEIARVLIEHGADVNAKADNDLSPIHVAAARGNLELVTLLLENGADLNAKSKDGKTPLTYAQEHDCTEMVEFLRGRL